MTTCRIVIVGGGGHGREVFATIQAANKKSPRWEVVGFVDDDIRHPDRIERLGAAVLGPVSWLEDHPSTYVLGIGTSATRRAISARLDSAGCEAATVVHPDADLGPDVELGPGVVVFARSTVTTNVRIGPHTHINVACAVQHDTRVGSFVQMSPGVLVNGDCRLGDDVFLGSGAVVTRGCRVGDRARIGAGAVVLNDVAADTTAVGMPATERI